MGAWMLLAKICGCFIFMSQCKEENGGSVVDVCTNIFN